MKLACTASCLECDWTAAATSMKAADSAANKHGRATTHATNWHCTPVRDGEE